MTQNPFYQLFKTTDLIGSAEATRLSSTALLPFIVAVCGHGVALYVAIENACLVEPEPRSAIVIPSVSFVENLPSLAGSVAEQVSKSATDVAELHEKSKLLPKAKSAQTSTKIPQKLLSLEVPHVTEQEDGGTDTVTQSAVSQAAPEYLRNRAPPYPPSARRLGQEGTVELLVVVSAAGKAESVSLSRTSGFPVLDQAALQAVTQWDFRPAEAGGVPTRSTILVPVRFELRKRNAAW